MLARLYDAQVEAGRVATACIKYHAAARAANVPWPGRTEMSAHTKGQFELHSQVVQQIGNQILANVDAARSRRINDPACRTRMKYPYHEKRFFPLLWPAQAVSYDAAARRLILPMGRGRKSLVFHVEFDFAPGAVKLVWCDGYELHIVRPIEVSPVAPGEHRACVDLGEIHQAAVVTDDGDALVVSGRGIRSQKRLLLKQIGQLARKRSRCKRGSRRWKRLARARRKCSRLAKRRIRDLRHKGTRRVIDFCVQHEVGHLFVGDPRSVRQKDCGRHHNQRVARWEMGKDIAYLNDKAKKADIVCSTGDERGTSSRCPQCGHRHKPTGRVWACKKCGFIGPRDVVGAANMHVNGFGKHVTFPAKITYRRPGPERAGRGVNNRVRISPVRRSRPDTGRVREDALLEAA